MLNKITEKELNMITYWRRKYGPISGEERDFLPEEYFMPTDRWLNYWEHSKKDLYNIFGENLILTKKVIVESFENEISQSIYDYIETHKFDDYNPFCQFISDFKQKLSAAGADWDSHRLVTNCHLAEKNVESIGFYKNKVSLGEYGEMTIMPEEKTIRVIRKISEKIGMDMQLFEKFRIQHSMFFNQKKFSGNLCLSIHPLDFITMSDNDHKWRSCMSWRNLGEYRMGTVDMMNSPCVVIAYFASEDGNMEEIEWNSKRWRELFVCDRDVIAGIKGYPYHSEKLENQVLDWLLELMGGSDKYSKRLNLYDNEYFDQDDIQFTVQFESGYMYNDFGCTKNGKNPVYLSNEYYNALAAGDQAFKYFNYSGPGQCVWCGALDAYFGDDGNSVLICEECTENIHYCYSCDSIIGKSFHLDINDRYYCEDCFNKYVQTDVLSGEQFDTREAYTCYAAYSLDNFEVNNAAGSLMTAHRLECYSLEQIRKITNGARHRRYRTRSSWNQVYVFLVGDLTPYGREVFGITQ